MTAVLEAASAVVIVAAVPFFGLIFGTSVRVCVIMDLLCACLLYIYKNRA